MNEPTTNTPTSSGKTLYIVLGIIVLIIILLVLSRFIKYPGNDNKSVISGSKVVQKLTPSNLPEAFPKDFPVDVTANLQPEDAIVTGGKSSTIRFVSNLSAEQSMVVYETYFTKHGWQILKKEHSYTFYSLSVKNSLGESMAVMLYPGKNFTTAITASITK